MSGVYEDLVIAGAVYMGRHFVYKSGKHGPGYIDMDVLYPDLVAMRTMSVLLAKDHINDRIEIVAAPAVGGVALSVHVGMWLRTQGVYADAVWADKNGSDFVIERAGFAQRIKGRRVLVVEDLLTTGASVAKVCAEVERCGGEVVYVEAICNRGGVTSENLGWPLKSLCSVDFEAVEADQCPYCAEGRPIVIDVGHGANYVKAHPDYPGGFIKLLVE